MRGRGSRSFLVPLAAAAILAGVAGCTMCPDPHDYSGPVPNGSPAQNDFRVRSNGILPVGATPPSWPTVVKAGAARPDVEPPDATRVADAVPAPPGTDAAPREADADTSAPDIDVETDVVRLSAEEEPARGLVVDAGVDRDSAETDDTAETATPEDAVGGDAFVAIETEAAPAASDDRPVQVAAPAPRETPGWRSRR